ncbi:hypothetical protein LENED_010415 [Lentinula edodes]|uniref:Uncharacterized protein n=1 Tax=Lentinula edodes TaxID=5353 RepID=A0A1Q3EMC9_LENED|nr:hypothetical protein LENED_010415 [Lentinula edodes]
MWTTTGSCPGSIYLRKTSSWNEIAAPLTYTSYSLFLVPLLYADVFTREIQRGVSEMWPSVDKTIKASYFTTGKSSSELLDESVSDRFSSSGFRIGGNTIWQSSPTDWEHGSFVEVSTRPLINSSGRFAPSWRISRMRSEIGIKSSSDTDKLKESSIYIVLALEAVVLKRLYPFDYVFTGKRVSSQVSKVSANN